MNVDKEFDRMIQGFTEQGKTMQERSKFSTLVGACIVMGVFSALGGLILMYVNNILLSAFPNADFLAPGIGFFSAYRLFFVILSLKLVFMALNNVQRQ
tara:strand:+ start:280 stop:573 length:294 start_codon:yes stop_codon:yes gene_type:complete